MPTPPTRALWPNQRLVERAKVAHRLGALDPSLATARAIGIGQAGVGLAAMVLANAIRYPSRTAIVDDTGGLSYRRLDRLVGALTVRLRRQDGTTPVGILCRNNRGFLVSQLAAERAGRDVVLLSTALPAAKLREIVERERVGTLIADDEFGALICSSELQATLITSEDVAQHPRGGLLGPFPPCPLPRRRSRMVLLTSGTTGPPRGARRTLSTNPTNALDLFADLPYRLGDHHLICPPLFHAWGQSQAAVALATASTVHLRRIFDVEEIVDVLRANPIDVLSVVPIMLRRLLSSDLSREDLTTTRLTLSSGNVLSGTLANEWMDRFGDNLYNLYGSTETAIGTIAVPSDLRTVPGTVGRPPAGVTVHVLDENGTPASTGALGRVHLGTSMGFSGYTDGGSTDHVGTLIATGDLGYVDRSGYLHVEGRVNDMIVTGGENVFPSRVEEVLQHHPAVEIAAVVGIPDEDYGQRVVAFVVPREGHSVSEADLLALARRELEAYKAPRQVNIVDSLPMTTTGKVIRRELAVLGDARRV